jgi:hypothetical protein
MQQLNESLKSKLDWAFEAYKIFKKGLQSDISNQLSDDEEGVTIITIGETQVGKTTLILKLIGITSESFKKVETILRGGRAKGKSATSVPVIYQMSSNNNWFVNNKTFVQDEDVIQELGLIRESMEKGKVSYDAMIVISIPKSYFYPENKIKISIIDLPGFNAATNDNERKFANEWAKKYSKKADLILLVMKADGLSLLENFYQNFPVALDIRINPNRFLVITSFTYSLETIKKFAPNCKEPDEILEHIVEEFKMFDISNINNIKNNIFPVEYGESWGNLNEKELAYFQKVEKFNNHYFDLLKKRITEKTSVSEKFKTALSINILRDNYIKKIISDLKDKQNKLIDSKNKFKKDVEKANLLIKLLNKENAQIKAGISGLNSFVKDMHQQLNDKKNEFEKDFIQATKESKNENTNFFFDEIEEFKNTILKIIQDNFSRLDTSFLYKNNKIDANLYKTFKSKFGEILYDAFIDLETILRNYFLEEYYPSLSNSYENDIKRFRDSMQNSIDKTLKFINSIKKDLTKEYQNLENSLISKKSDIIRNKEVINYEIIEINNKLKNIESQINQYEDLKNNDLSKKFKILLLDSYKKQFNQVFENIKKTKNPNKKLLNIFLLLMIVNEKKKIFLE